MNKQMSLPATLKDVSGMVTALDPIFEELPVAVRTEISLALQELGVNIVRHAYAGESGSIHVKLDWVDEHLRVTLTDTASNGFEMPDAINAPDPFDLPESGMGLFIIQQAFETVKYERLASGNQWTLEKSLKSART